MLCVGLAAVSADAPNPSSGNAPEPPNSPAQPTSPTEPTPPAPPGPSPPRAPDPRPSPSPIPSPKRGGDTASVDGRYECFQIRIIMGPNFSTQTQWVPGALPGFTIASGAYTSAGGGGSISVAAPIVSFDGGAYNGWRGTSGANSTGAYIYFRGKDHGNPQPNEGAKSGDYQCYRQK